MRGPYAFPGVAAGLEQPLVAEELIGFRQARQAAVHLIDLAIADQRDIIILAQQGDELQAGRLVHLLDAFVDHGPHFRFRAQFVQVAEGIQHAAAGHTAVHAGLCDLDPLVEDGPVQEFRQAQGAVGIFRIARRDTDFGETLDQVGDDPGIPVHHHRFRSGSVIEALVFAIAAEVSVLFLEGKQIIRHGGQVGEQLRISRALIGAGSGIHPFAGVLAPPAALALLDHFRGEQGDGFALRTVDVMSQTAVVAGIDGMAEQAADDDGKEGGDHGNHFFFLSSRSAFRAAFWAARKESLAAFCSWASI